MKLEFFKYHGTGNDFVIIDNRKNLVSLTHAQVARMCHRRFGIGADGLMLLNHIPGYDFEMKYYNADGKEGSMCGNGGRALVQFANDMGIRKSSYSFIATDGPHEANFDRKGWVHLKMKDVHGIRKDHGNVIVDTGSPHYVKVVTDVQRVDVVAQGKDIRYNKEFKKEGINVNFVEQGKKKIIVRTYERGVEDETLSCGTGVTASALVCAHNDSGFNRVEVETLGGNLAVEFDKLNEKNFENIWLCGPATFVFKGEAEVVSI